MRAGDAVVVLSPGGGHLQRLLPLIAGLVRRGRPVHVLTRAAGRAAVEATGAAFIDLLARFPLDAVDSESIPLPSRWVTFAAAYAEPLITAVAALRPGLIVYDSFAVAAPRSSAGASGCRTSGCVRVTRKSPPRRLPSCAPIRGWRRLRRAGRRSRRCAPRTTCRTRARSRTSTA
jgi:hypothetical protein